MDYLSDERLDMVKHATKEAKRLDLGLCFHNYAGWGTTGGPIGCSGLVARPRRKWVRTRTQRSRRLGATEVDSIGIHARHCLED